MLDYLINDLGQDPVAKDKDGLTTVHAAAQNERASTVKVRRTDAAWMIRSAWLSKEQNVCHLLPVSVVYSF